MTGIATDLNRLATAEERGARAQDRQARAQEREARALEDQAASQVRCEAMLRALCSRLAVDGYEADDDAAGDDDDDDDEQPEGVQEQDATVGEDEGELDQRSRLLRLVRRAHSKTRS